MNKKLITAIYVIFSVMCILAVILDSMGRDLFPRRLDSLLTGEEPELPSGAICVLTYNVAHGRGTAFHQIFTGTKKIRKNLKILAEYVNNVSPDVAGFQEVDIDCSWSGNFNHAEFIAEKSGYPYSCYGINNLNEGSYKLNYGNSIISKYAIVENKNYAFGNATIGEKGFIVAEIEINGRVITFVNVHLDYKLAKNRKRQIEQMIEILGKVTNPMVVMGDFNCRIDSREENVRTFLKELNLKSWDPEKGRGETFPSHKPISRIDFIFISKELEFVDCVSPGKVLTDHLPVIAVIKFSE